VIRQATAVDASWCARLLGDWVRETGWMPVLHSREEDLGFVAGLIARTEVLVAEGGFLARERDEVLALYLAPEVRGRGVGKALLDAAKERRERLTLWVFQRNAGALRFYAREGFAEVERTDGARNDERLPDVRMVWERERE
jgi:GNAT superfamily N-acetyltransferase